MLSALVHWLLNRTTFLSRPGVGDLMVSVRRWAPNRTHSIEYRPEGSKAVYRLPKEAWGRVLSAKSTIEVMAVVRDVNARQR